MTGARDGLQPRLRAAPDPARDHRRPARDRRPAVAVARAPPVGREDAFAGLLTRALRLLIFVMVPIACLTAVARQPVVEILFGGGKLSRADLDLIAVDPRRLPGRPDRPLADRGPRPRLLRPPGHDHAGRRGGRGGRHQLHAGGHPRRAVRAAGDRHRHRDRGLDRGDRPSRDPLPPAAALRAVGSRPGQCRVGRRAALVAGAVAAAALGGIGDCARCRSRAADPRRRGGHRQRRVRPRLRRALARVADPGTAVYRRGHGRRHPPPGQVVTDVDPGDWDGSSRRSDPGSYLQTSAWAAVKAVNGWAAHRVAADE